MTASDEEDLYINSGNTATTDFVTSEGVVALSGNGEGECEMIFRRLHILYP